MSPAHERGALNRPVSLFEHARRLVRQSPDGPLPDSGCPPPDDGARPYVPAPERRRALTAVLQEFIGDPSLSAIDLHERCAQLIVHVSDVRPVVDELAPERSRRLLAAARWLLGSGWDRCAVLVGLGLLGGHAAARDVPTVRTVGLLRFADLSAMEVLVKVPGAEHDIIWLAERSRSYLRVVAVRALAGQSDPVVRQWVLSTPRELLDGGLARQIAEGCAMADMLSGPEAEHDQWDQVGKLLLAMTSATNSRSHIGSYEDAAVVYQQWVARAQQLPATLERAALLAMALQDLCTGQAAPVLGGSRAGLIERIKAVLSSAPWSGMLRHHAGSADPVEARRAAWVRSEVSRNDIPDSRFAIRVAVPDPSPVGFPLVEARIVIDGMPIVPAAFDRGPCESPERLVHSGQLRATSEAQQVMLAEAYCTEGCCGGLFTTIMREGKDVVWRYWRSSTADPPQEVRFGAAEYDREVARAEQDHSWEWPARTVARLVSEALRADPTVLSRWNCAPGWCTAWLKDFDAARLTFTYPARPESIESPSLQFGLVIDVPDNSPDTVAAEIIESMRTTNPMSVAEMIGGSKDAPEKLGLAYRKPTRW